MNQLIHHRHHHLPVGAHLITDHFHVTQLLTQAAPAAPGTAQQRPWLRAMQLHFPDCRMDSMVVIALTIGRCATVLWIAWEREFTSYCMGKKKYAFRQGMKQAEV
jgi:hypothetical protein